MIKYIYFLRLNVRFLFILNVKFSESTKLRMTYFLSFDEDIFLPFFLLFRVTAGSVASTGTISGYSDCPLRSGDDDEDGIGERLPIP